MSDTTTQVGEGIIIDNSVDIIWADMTSPNTGYTSNMPKGYGQFEGHQLVDINKRQVASINRQNVWFEIESAGDGGDCSSDMNRATNTLVEIGWARLYFLMNDDSWVLVSETKDQIKGGNGGRHPNTNSNFSWESERCNSQTKEFYNIQKSQPGTVVMTRKVGQFTTAEPNNYYRYHAWASRVPIDLSRVKGVFGQVYMRLIVKNPNLPDDRHLADYVAHIGSDSSNTNDSYQYKGGNGISRYKKITNNWQPINFLSGAFTKAKLETNPPPFTSTP